MMNPSVLSIVGAALIAFLGVVLFVFVNEFRRRQNNYYKEKELMNAEFQHALLESRLEIQEETFKKISQEIHDNIGQMLTLVKLHLNNIDISLHSPSSENIEKANSLLTNAIQDLRDISKTMNTDIISRIGVIKAIQLELDLIEKASGIKTKFIDNNSPDHISPEVELILFRIIQEALHNCIKHAQASLIEVMVYGKDKLEVVVKDNGIGFDPNIASVKGSGLTNIESRCKLINANLTLQSSPGEGTVIHIIL